MPRPWIPSALAGPIDGLRCTWRGLEVGIDRRRYGKLPLCRQVESTQAKANNGTSSLHGNKLREERYPVCPCGLAFFHPMHLLRVGF